MVSLQMPSCMQKRSFRLVVPVLIVLAFFLFRPRSPKLATVAPQRRSPKLATVAPQRPPPVLHKDIPFYSQRNVSSCKRYSESYGVQLSDEERDSLDEDVVCKLIGSSCTYLDCINELSKWEERISHRYLKGPNARPLGNVRREHFSETLLNAWSFHLASSCRKKARGAPARFLSDVDWLQARHPQTAEASSLSLFNWNGLRFAVGTNICWKNSADAKDKETFFAVVEKGENPTEPFPPEEEVDEKNWVKGRPDLHSRFMRNPVLWRAYGPNDRLVTLKVKQVDDREAFLRKHMVDAPGEISWFIGCAWAQHIAHATESLWAALNLHLLVPSLQARSVVSVCTNSPTKPTGSANAIHYLYHSVADVIGDTTGKRPFTALMDKAQPLFPHNEWHCFPTIAFGGHNFLPRCNGPFAHPQHGGALRRALVKNILGAEHKPKRSIGKEGLSILYLERVTNRLILNKDELIQAIKQITMGGIKVTVRVEVFDHKPFKEQLELMQNTDILVSPHGQGLHNGIWMEANSAAVEMFAPFWHTTDFANPIISAGSFHFGYKHILNDDQGKGEACCQKCCASDIHLQMGFNALLEGCNESRSCNHEVDIDKAIAMFKRAMHAVLLNKYGK